MHAPYLSRDTDLASPDEEVRKFALEQVKRSIRFCADIGGSRVTYHPGFISPGDGKEDRIAALKRSIETLQKGAVGRGIKLCLENMGNGRPQYLVLTPEEHVALHRETGTWVTLDVVHLASWCSSLSEIDEHLGVYAPITANIHLNDMPESRHRHVPLGDGVLPIPHMLGRLVALGYRGAAIVDEFARPIPSEEYIRRTQEFIRQLEALAA